MTVWGDIYNRLVRRGHDHGSAAYTADQWEKRQIADRWKECCLTHCERRQECSCPNECCANLKNLRAACAAMGESDD